MDELRERDSRAVWSRLNSNISNYPRAASVHRLFSEQARKTPQAVAITCGSQSVTYLELERRSNLVAWDLVNAGITAERAVGILMERSVSMIASMLGILKSGASYLPIDTQNPLDRVAFVIKDANVQTVLTDKHNKFRLSGVKAKLVLAEEVIERDLSGADSCPPERATPESRAYVMYTSGSTGTPKGVEILHRGVTRLVRNTNYIAFAPDDVVAQIANPAFDALTFEVWGALLNGGRLLILPTDVVLSPSRFAESIRSERVTTMFLTASLFSVMADTEPAAFGGMRTLIVGGDVVKPDAARKVLTTAPPQNLVNGYGPTECTTFSICHQIKAVPDSAKSIPIGKPISNSEAYILDDSLRPVAEGVTGNLYLGGDGLARGYLNCPELTSERFISHAFSDKPGARLYYSGDRARLNGDGFIEYLGRADYQVKFHGYRIELPEVEAALNKNPGVVDCVVTVWNASPNDRRLVAHVAHGNRTAPSEQELRSFLNGLVPSYMVPAHIVVLEALPLNGIGKIDRSALEYPKAMSDRRTDDLPANLLEKQIAEIWQEVLSTTSVSRNDNFFDLGGTSITLALVEHKLRSRCSRPFETTDLFRYPTVRLLSEFLSQDVVESSWKVDLERRATRQKASFQRTRLSTPINNS